MKPSNTRTRNTRTCRSLLAIPLATMTVAAVLASLIIAAPASASIGGTFVPVAVGSTCTLSTGFSTVGTATCGPGIGGAKYIYLPASGGSLTYAFTVPSGSSESVTYGIPAGGFLNNVDATVSFDGGAPVTLSSHLGAFDQTTASDVALWSDPSVGPGAHTWKVTSNGDAVNIYGLWVNENVTSLSTSLSDGGQSGTSISTPPGTPVNDSSVLTGTNASAATGTVTYTVYADAECTTAVNAGPAEAIITPGTLPNSGPVTLTTPATYYWQASYSGDGANAAAVSACGVEVETVLTPTMCTPGTTGCTATVTTPQQTVDVTGTKLSTTSATITVSLTTQVLSCPNFDYAAQVATLTDAGLTGKTVVVTDIVQGLPSKKGVVICYQPVEASPPPPAFLAKCHGSQFVPPCYKNLKEVGGEVGSVVATLELPPGDPRFHVGGETPAVTGIKPSSVAPGKKLTVEGANLSEVTGVTVGGVAARIIKTAPTKVKIIVPAGARSGVIAVTSLAGVSISAALLTVT